MTVFEDLERRGLIAQCTNLEEVARRLNNEKVTFYIGFDATADSLHVGHYLQLSIMRRLQLAGHMPILLLGTGTTMVGDPSGKSDMRKMLTVEEIKYNAEQFVKQMGRFLDLTPGKAIVAYNGDWLMNLNYIQLLREVGVHFSVNRMLAAECFKSRMERGLSFLEFNYMIMQSYDFLHLFREYDCTMQFGGNDQWSNILFGADLVRRVEGKEVFGMTYALLATKDGKKMGKTEKGALWLDRDKTSPYDFFQYWRNVDDTEVITCLKYLTFLPIEQIEEMAKWEGSQLNRAKEILAYELTAAIHSKEDADAALEAARALFSAGSESDSMPTTALTAADLDEGGLAVLDLLVKTGLTASKGEGRRLITQGGVFLNDAKVTDTALILSAAELEGGLVIRKGKKVFHKVVLG